MGLAGEKAMDNQINNQANNQIDKELAKNLKINPKNNPKINMVKQQVQPGGVSDPSVISALLSVHRENFVPEKYRAFAYADWMIPLERGQVMLSPLVEGKMLQALKLTKKDHVLEIGTGSGYFSALLGKLSKHVFSVDISRDFSDLAALNTVSYGVNNICFETGDASQSWKPSEKNQKLFQGTFDAIVFTGAMPVIPKAYKNLLGDGGRLVAILGTAPVMTVVRVTAGRNAQGERVFLEESLFETLAPPLRNSASTPTLSTFQF